MREHDGMPNKNRKIFSRSVSELKMEKVGVSIDPAIYQGNGYLE
jgi:hypothetical protein